MQLRIISIVFSIFLVVMIGLFYGRKHRPKILIGGIFTLELNNYSYFKKVLMTLNQTKNIS